MHRSKLIRKIAPAVAVGFLSAAALLAPSLAAAQSASPADQGFVAKVSQGGLYEVEAGKIAALRGQSPVVKDFGLLESQDHEGVNSELKRIADSTGVAIKPGLNSEFSLRLAKLKAVPPAQFDAFYISDMKQIHTKDEGLFAKEAEEGSAPYKNFAHQTAILVNAHLGWLNTL
jgi:putative membrane protein